MCEALAFRLPRIVPWFHEAINILVVVGGRGEEGVEGGGRMMLHFCVPVSLRDKSGWAAATLHQ